MSCHAPERRLNVCFISERHPLHLYVTCSRPSANKIGVTSVIVISLLQFGQISIVDTTERASLVLMMFPFAQRMSGRAKRFTLARVPVSLKGRSWN
jgi:hypothetical protein